jgi:formylglycine-generating enzyme required for sulfatase activity
MIALRGGAVALGTLEKEQADELARCKSELAIDARDCTAERIAREVPRAAELRPYDLDALEVDTATFTAWIAAELAAGKATLDAKGVVVAEGQPLLTTGTQHAGVDVAKAPAGTLVVREGFASRPVTMVSWIGANRYCAAHDRRLPTELEWEAAARDGKRTEFPWGDDVPACEAVDFGGTAKRKCAARAPRDVGTSPRDVTRTGVHDLAGSVMEWVDGPGAGADDHPMRGGSWVGSAFEARSARRRFGKAVEMLADLGFRCARDSR